MSHQRLYAVDTDPSHLRAGDRVIHLRKKQTGTLLVVERPDKGMVMWDDQTTATLPLLVLGKLGAQHQKQSQPMPEPPLSNYHLCQQQETHETTNKE